MGSQDGQQLGSEVDAALGEIERGIDGLRGGASTGLPEESLRSVLRAGFRLRNRLDAALTELVGCLDEAIQAHDYGDPTISCVAWLREERHLSSYAHHDYALLASQRPLRRTALTRSP